MVERSLLVKRLLSMEELPFERLRDKMTDFPPTEKHQQSIKTVKSFFKALESRDIDAVIELWHDDGVLEFPFAPDGAPKTATGKAHIKQVLGEDLADRSRVTFPHLDIQPMLNPESVVAEFTSDMEVASSEEIYANQYVAIAKVKDGRLLLFREYFNPLVDLEAGNPRQR